MYMCIINVSSSKANLHLARAINVYLTTVGGYQVETLSHISRDKNACWR